MADGPHAGVTAAELARADSKTLMTDIVMDYRRSVAVVGDKVNNHCYPGRENSGGEKVFLEGLCGVKPNSKKSSHGASTTAGSAAAATKEEGSLDDDCRKKRCVDRYDSSESSDSGVAVLSCTDCSGSSTASSDITDPGSPFSTASNHSEDSGGTLQPPKMPPAQSAHHPPWPWTSAHDGSSPQPSAAAPYAKRLRTAHEAPKKQPADDSSLNNNNYRCKKTECVPKMQQGKITEYFKTHGKANGVRKQLLKMKGVKVPLISQISGMRNTRSKKEAKTRTVPRKILPAPSKVQETHPPTNVHSFTPTVTLTAVSFPPNLAYLHAKTPKPPDNLFLPQVNSIPLINRVPIINNFNCVKLNATVVPIVNINALPPRLNAAQANIALSVDTAMPTVLPARPKSSSTSAAQTKQFEGGAVQTSAQVNGTQQQRRTESTTTEEPYRTEECQTHQEERPQEPPDDKTWQEESQSRILDQKSPSPTDSDSGFSSRGSLEISVDEPVTEPPKKSPILSQPKTIRFPPVQRQKAKEVGRDLGKSPPQSTDGQCRWNECSAQFDTSGALLEHLQVEHVISQSRANQEQYVCLWRGCKVHGRTSCSISWLERHVLAHAGTKPFRCIVDGCGQRFNSQLMLERHVNNHFNTDGSQNTSAKKSVENGPVKLFKRNGRIIRFRRQPWSARMFDFIDSGIMEGLQHKLLKMTQTRTLGQMGSPGETMSLQSQILAKRTDAKGCKELLVRWHPRDVVPDEWISEKEYKPTKALPITSLPPEGREALRPALFPGHQGRTGHKHRRKPLRPTT